MENLHNRQSHIHEIDMMRALACLSIVLLHAIDRGFEQLPYLSELPQLTVVFWDSFNMLLYFGTPMFVFISEFLLAYAYKQKMPAYFIQKRVKYILLPFIVMGIYYALPAIFSEQGFIKKALMNVFIGDYHGYFVLIIFQFYFLHIIYKKYMHRFSAKVVLCSAFVINALYLTFFNFVPPFNIPHAEYIWYRLSWIPFVGWIFYFTLAYYCGYYFDTFKQWLHKYSRWIMVAPVVTSMSVLYLYHSGSLIEHSSKRVDMLFHTAAVIFFMFYMATKLSAVPRFFSWISQYSFGIYLWHMSFIAIINVVLYDVLQVNLGAMTFVILFGSSIILSVAVVYHMSQWNFGPYIVGKINVKKDDGFKPFKSQAQPQPQTEAVEIQSVDTSTKK